MKTWAAKWDGDDWSLFLSYAGFVLCVWLGTWSGVAVFASFPVWKIAEGVTRLVAAQKKTTTTTTFHYRGDGMTAAQTSAAMFRANQVKRPGSAR